MDGDILISVVVPNYNGAKYIKDTVNSVLNQSYNFWEMIIVDDGSTDESEHVVQHFHDNRIRFYRRGGDYPKGANACRNIGIKKASGDYLIFLDSDDLLSVNCLKNRLDYLKQHPNLLFAVFPSIKFSENPSDGKVFTRLLGVNPVNHFFCTDNLWQTSSVIWRRDFVLSINGYNIAYQRLQDPEMTLRALIAAKGNFGLSHESIPDIYYRRPLIQGPAKLLASYKAMFQFINDFYIDQNLIYINSHNTLVMFYHLSNLHLECCHNLQDKNDYLLCAKKLIHYNSGIQYSIIFFVCKYKILFNHLRYWKPFRVIFSRYVSYYKKKNLV